MFDKLLLDFFLLNIFIDDYDLVIIYFMFISEEHLYFYDVFFNEYNLLFEHVILDISYQLT